MGDNGEDGPDSIHPLVVVVLPCQQVGIEIFHITHFGLLHIVAESRLHALQHIVRVLSLGQGQTTHMEAVVDELGQVLHCCMDAGTVTVIDEHHVLGVAMQQLPLVLREGRATAGDGVLQTYLIEGKHVELPFYYIHLVLLPDFVACLVESEDVLSLGEEDGLARVLVLGRLVVDGASREANHLTASVVEREDDALPEGVAQLVLLLVVLCHVGCDEVLLLASLVDELAGESVEVEGVAKSVGCDGLRTDAASGDVGECLRGAVEVAGELRLCLGDDNTCRFQIVIVLLLLGCQLHGWHVDVVLLAQVPDRLGILEVVELLAEGDDIATLSTGEALVDALHGIDIEACVVVVVERAEADIVHAALAEGDVVANLTDDVHFRDDAVDNGLWYS